MRSYLNKLMSKISKMDKNSFIRNFLLGNKILQKLSFKNVYYQILDTTTNKKYWLFASDETDLKNISKNIKIHEIIINSIIYSKTKNGKSSSIKLNADKPNTLNIDGESLNVKSFLNEIDARIRKEKINKLLK